jgi:hypothetical protein
VTDPPSDPTTKMTDCECGHVYDEHENGGRCYAGIDSVMGDPDGVSCPCVHFDAAAGSATPHGVEGHDDPDCIACAINEHWSATPDNDEALQRGLLIERSRDVKAAGSAIPTAEQVTAWLTEHRWRGRIMAVGGGYTWGIGDVLAAREAVAGSATPTGDDLERLAAVRASYLAGDRTRLEQLLCIPSEAGSATPTGPCLVCGSSDPCEHDRPSAWAAGSATPTEQRGWTAEQVRQHGVPGERWVRCNTCRDHAGHALYHDEAVAGSATPTGDNDE